MKNGQRVDASFYASDTLQLAKELLGKLFVRQHDGQRLSGVIVECEAYLSQGDAASHSHRGPGRRNAAMFMPAGTLYVYSIHAKFCLNVVSAPEGQGEAILIRGLEPWEGIDSMRVHRRRADSVNTNDAGRDYRELCSGPARLCQSLGIDKSLDGSSLVESEQVWIETAPLQVTNRSFAITATPRIGISNAKEALYRFFIDGHRCVSGLARQHQVRRDWLFASSGNDSPTPGKPIACSVKKSILPEATS